MIELMKYTYLLKNGKIEQELEKLWEEYSAILESSKSSWEELNKSRAILYLVGQIYCEQICVDVIKRRLHLLKQPLQLFEFLNLVDSNSEELSELRKDKLFKDLEEFYKIIKKFKNKYSSGKYYLEEEKFIELYNSLNPKKDLKVGYKGEFDKKSLDFLR